MPLTSFTRGVLDNLGVKLVALVVALVIWFNASGQQVVNRTYDATLSFVNLPDTLTLTGPVPDVVALSITGTRRELLVLGFRKIDMLISLTRASPGRFTQRLSVSDILLPPGVEPGDVRVLTPLSVTVGIERIVSKRMQIVANLANGLPEGFMLSGVPIPFPNRVMVRGPESAVAPINKLQTEPIDLSRIRETETRDVSLDYDIETLSVQPDRVSVTIPVSPRAERVLAHIPPTLLVDDAELTAEVFPKTVAVTVVGLQSIIDTLSSGDVSVLLDLSGKGVGTYVFAPEVIVPDGVERYVVDVESLRVVLERGDAQSMN